MTVDGKILVSAAMAVRSIRYYKTGTLSPLPKGFVLLRSFGTAAVPRLGMIVQSADLIVAAFRGTENPNDILRDLDISRIPYPYARSAGSTHRGFTMLYSAMREPFLSAIRGLSRRKPLLLTGHSLGGALATLAGLDLSAHANRPLLSVVTFGSPRVGDERFAAAFDRAVKDSIRIFNENDLVPRFPPEWFGYRHVRRGKAIRFDGGSLFADHVMSGYYHALTAARLPGAR